MMPIEELRFNLPVPARPAAVGEVFSCGHGDFGQLGLGNGVTEKTRPAEVRALHDAKVVAVEAGGMHTVALTAEGKVFSWGVNDEFALGRNTSSRTIDTIGDDVGPLENADSIEFVKLSAGDSFTIGLDKDGNVWGWGQFRNSNGGWKLSNDTQKSLVPIRIPTQGGLKAVDLSAGSDHVVLLTEDGQIQTVGTNDLGQLGRTLRTTRRTTSDELSLGAHYVDDRFQGDVHGVSVHTGSYHTLVRGNDGTLYTFGLNKTGQLGWGVSNQHEYAPVVGYVDIPSKVVDADGGEHHSIAVNDLGHVYTWGRNDSYQLGIGHNKDTPRPQRVTALEGVNIVSVRASGHMSAAISSEGKVYVWGDGQCGQLALGNLLDLNEEEDESVRTPTVVELKTRHVLDWSFGGQHTAMLLTPKTD